MTREELRDALRLIERLADGRIVDGFRRSENEPMMTIWEQARKAQRILASLDTEAVKAEREACAKVARSYEDALRPPASWSDEQKDWWETGVADAAGAIESAIRARMEQP